jgi:hypothetical protein
MERAVALSVSYKPFGSERGREIGEVVLIDPDLVVGEPVLDAALTPVGEVTALLIPRGDGPGITELGHMTRAKAERIAAEHGVPLSEH